MNARHILTSFALCFLFAASGCDDKDDGGSNAPVDPCASYCSVEMTCDPEFDQYYDSNAECVAQCEDDLALFSSYGEDCGSAFEALALCIGALSCEEHADYWEEPTPDYPCADEDINIEYACIGL